LTLSYSSSVPEVLCKAHGQQCLSKVFCTESRPVQEGRRLAQALTATNIAVEFGVDAVAASSVRTAF
jgi:translation initiation factor 2B subunit (eIF-2B alpha/beta/delta family)